jgi:hypothetical protein
MKSTRTDKTDPLIHMVGLMAMGSGYIESMEAKGQQEVVHSDLLPLDGPNTDVLEKLGFKIGEKVEDDDLFRHVTLPEGWSRKGGEHSMQSSILDAKGRERISVFYKAAYYDRKASWSLLPRYTTTWNNDKDQAWCVKDADGTILFQPDGMERSAAMDACYAWVKERFPTTNAIDYWD